MNHITGLCGSYSTQLYTTFYTAYTTDLQCMLSVELQKGNKSAA